MGKTRVIAETGQASTEWLQRLSPPFGMECEVFMGKKDTERQALNVYRMELLGAKVHAVESGTQVLKDAVNEAMSAGRVLHLSHSGYLIFEMIPINYRPS